MPGNVAGVDQRVRFRTIVAPTGYPKVLAVGHDLARCFAGAGCQRQRTGQFSIPSLQRMSPRSTIAKLISVKSPPGTTCKMRHGGLASGSLSTVNRRPCGLNVLPNGLKSRWHSVGVDCHRLGTAIRCRLHLVREVRSRSPPGDTIRPRLPPIPNSNCPVGQVIPEMPLWG